jgi:hypothetical protein
MMTRILCIVFACGALFGSCGAAPSSPAVPVAGVRLPIPEVTAPPIPLELIKRADPVTTLNPTTYTEPWTVSDYLTVADSAQDLALRLWAQSIFGANAQEPHLAVENITVTYLHESQISTTGSVTVYSAAVSQTIINV